MRVVRLAHQDDHDGWRAGARALAAAGAAPDTVSWRIGDEPGDLFGAEALPPAAAGEGFPVPRRFLTQSRQAICHGDPERFSLLYALLLRLRAQPKAIDDEADPLVRRIALMAKDVRRDMHKMHAFVRFREVSAEGAEPRYVAWFEPDHHILRTNAGFFVRRFANMAWSILTPELSIHWDRDTLLESPGAVRADAPGGDPVEEVWKTYYASIFNPARVKTRAMLKEMPKKYWKNMPETGLVAPLLAGARARVDAMLEKSVDDC
jgi:DNA polymerase